MALTSTTVKAETCASVVVSHGALSAGRIENSDSAEQFREKSGNGRGCSVLDRLRSRRSMIRHGQANPPSRVLRWRTGHCVGARLRTVVDEKAVRSIQIGGVRSSKAHCGFGQVW